MTDNTKRPFGVTVLFFLAALAYGFSVSHGFVWDDWSIFSRPWFSPPITRPLTEATLWLNHAIGGEKPAGYHCVNVLLHFLNIWLAWRALARVMPARAAAIATMIFALHPLQAQAVNYVWARSTLLMTAFCLLSLRDWLDGRGWWAASWFACALLSKEECAAFGMLLVAMHFALGRPRRELGPAGAMVAMAGAAGAYVAWAASVTAGSQAGSQSAYSSVQYFGAQGHVIPVYLLKFAAPLYPFSPDPDVPEHGGWIGWLVVAAIGALALFRFAGLRAGFWLLGGLILLVPSSSWFPANDLAADRRMYFPVFAFAGWAGLLLARFSRAVVVVIAIALTFLTAIQTYYWHEEASFWREACRNAPAKLRPKIQLARVVPPQEALPLLEAARKLAPDDPVVATESGRTYLRMERHGEALREFGRALALAPNDPMALSNRGVALLALGQREAATADFERALAADPCAFEPRYNLKRIGIQPAALPARCHFTEWQRRALELGR